MISGYFALKTLRLDQHRIEIENDTRVIGNKKFSLFETL
jgi:hypothetical protein